MKFTYTKKILTAILIVALIDLQLPFILAAFGREQIAESLAIAIVTEIIGVFIGYCAKSFFETREEEKIKFMKFKMGEKEDEEDEV